MRAEVGALMLELDLLELRELGFATIDDQTLYDWFPQVCCLQFFCFNIKDRGVMVIQIVADKFMSVGSTPTCHRIYRQFDSAMAPDVFCPTVYKADPQRLLLWFALKIVVARLLKS